MSGGPDDAVAPGPLVFRREMEPVEYLMFRGEQDPRSRSAMLSVVLLAEVPDMAALRTAFDRASRVVVRLRQRVVVPALPVAPPEWVIDPDFDLDFHLRRSRLTEPGTIRHLLDVTQPIFAAPFDTARPLWEAHLIDGITEGDAPAALVMKLNHAVTDGVGGVELFKQLYDLAPGVDRGPMPPLPVPEDLSPSELVRRAGRKAPITFVGDVSRRATRAIELGNRAVRRPGRAVQDVGRFVGSARRVLGAPPVPPSPLLRRRSLGRRLDWLELPFDPFRRAAKAAGGSVNDAYISAICGALRRYHEALGVPVDAVPLAMPVNLRSDDDPAGGNRFAGARIAAPVGDPDPARRILTIREAVLGAVAEPAVNALGAVAPVLSRLPAPLLGVLSTTMASTDVQASNVPGYPVVPYLAGVAVRKTLPFGPLPGVPMMVILLTQAGVCYVGVHYDTASVTEHELFAACLRAGFDEVVALDPGPPSPARKAPARKAPARKAPTATARTSTAPARKGAR
ncbi:MAG: wax ester/triacylglycerol synthase domain-containing protein [Ilumatobacteraceae bacterium]